MEIHIIPSIIWIFILYMCEKSKDSRWTASLELYDEINQAEFDQRLAFSKRNRIYAVLNWKLSSKNGDQSTKPWFSFNNEYLQPNVRHAIQANHLSHSQNISWNGIEIQRGLNLSLNTFQFFLWFQKQNI